ncbi:hypothetical protein PI125_g11081 [Phytophthora idaei]|nr:hypothetical protein PI125_g11081 [Phytophthora idaei]
MAARRQQVLNGSTKYKHAFECGKSIADIMSRNVTFVFKDDDERIVEIEEIAKDGVAPFVGREGECVDPISRLPSLEFSPTPGGNTANYDTADIAAKCSDTDASMGRRSNGSDDDNPPPPDTTCRTTDHSVAACTHDRCTRNLGCTCSHFYMLPLMYLEPRMYIQPRQV